MPLTAGRFERRNDDAATEVARGGMSVQGFGRAGLRAPCKVLCVSAAIAVAAAMLAACESVDEGVTDYRKATIDTDSAAGEPTSLSKKYELSATTPAPDGNDIPVAKGDQYYVSMLQAYVGPDAGFWRSTSFGGREELVLVLRVHDSNDENSPGRLAFYSDDVSRGQFLNFSNLLTIGPTDYAGGVMTIDVDEIRLIGTTEHIKEKLQALADDQYGAFGPDPSKRRDWQARERDLFNLIDMDGYGTRYTLTLLPSGGIAGLPYPRFEAGNYVLMRHEARNDAFEWNALALDNNTGRLVYRGTRSDANGAVGAAAPCEGCDPGNAADAGDYRERSYVTLQINKLHAPPAAPPQYKSLDRETQEKKCAAEQANPDPRGRGDCPRPGT